MLKIKGAFTSWSKKKIGLLLIVLILVITASVLFFNKKPTNATANNIQTAAVQRGTIEHTIDGTGTLQPSERYALKTWAGGTVTEVLVTAGTQVKMGQPLLRVKNDELESQARTAHLEWDIAQRELADLVKPLDETDYNRRSAELKVEQFQLQLEDRLLQRDKLVVTAPFDGTILSMDLSLGQRVNSGIQAASLVSSGEVEVVVPFSEQDINLLRPDMEAQLHVGALSRTYTGRVKEVAPQATTIASGSNSSTFDVLIKLDEPDDDLRSGMRAYVTIIVVRDKDQDLFIYKQAAGNIRYTQTEKITTEANGTVTELIRKAGDKVKKGDPILRLANEDLNRQVKDAENQLANAQEELKRLLSPDEQTIKQQQLKVEQNYQKVLAANKKLDTLNVVSPIDGVVVSIAVNPGDELGADDSSKGQELLVVCNFEKNYLQITVDELDINRIKFGQEASVKIDALANADAKGIVTGIAQEGTISDGITKYPITLEVGYVEGIKAGMTATATISLEKKENVLRVPAEAVTTSNGRSAVQVLENGEPVTKPVRVGVNTGRWIEIINGLEEGEQIVIARTQTAPQMQFGPGMGVPGGFRAPGQQQQRSPNSNNSGR